MWVPGTGTLVQRPCTMPVFYVTVAPESRDQHPFAAAPTWVIEAGDEDAARDKAELRYRRRHPQIERLRVRVRPAPTRRS